MRIRCVSLTAIITILCAMPVVARDFEYTYQGQTLTYTVLDEDAKTVETKQGIYSYGVATPGNKVSGKLTIPVTVTDGEAQYTVVKIGMNGFPTCDITEINFPETLLNIGSYAFQDCVHLQSVIVPPSVVECGTQPFQRCTGLKKTAYPLTIYPSIRDGAYVAYEPEGAIIEDGWIYGPEKKEIRFVPYTLSGAYAVPETVNSIGQYAFSGCVNLTSVEIPSTVTYIANGIFEDCYELKSVTLPETLTAISSNMFRNCTSLEAITLPNKVEYINNYSFSGCSNLASITFGISIKSIYTTAFESCRNITTVTCQSPTPLYKSNKLFDYEVYKNATLYVPEDAVDTYKSTAPWNKFSKINNETLTHYFDYTYKGETLTYTVPNQDQRSCTLVGGNVVGELIIPATAKDGDTEYAVTSIGDYTFYGCSNMTSVSIPNSVTTIDDYAFYGCSSMTSVIIGNYVNSIGKSAFSRCDNLASVIFPNTLTTIGKYAFEYCRGLTSVTIPSSVTKINEGTFYSCSRLASVSIPNTVTEIGEYAFCGCSSLASLILPKGLETIERNAFDLCNDIKKIEYLAESPVAATEDIFTTSVYENATLYVPEGAVETYRSTVPWNKFSNINNEPVYQDFQYTYEGQTLTYTILDRNNRTCMLKSGSFRAPGNSISGELVIPAIAKAGDTEYTVTAIGDYAFSSCNDLTSVTIPNSIIKIDDYAFLMCQRLPSITIPKSVTTIGIAAFYGCFGLTNIFVDQDNRYFCAVDGVLF